MIQEEQEKQKKEKLEFKGKIILELKITLETGLHIGAGREVTKIGGLDNPIIRDPLTQNPYIPGSSLKGKIRSLLEKSLEKTEDIHACCDKNCEICRLFGSDKIGEGRLIFRDFEIVSNKKEIEIKIENKVSRLTGQASDPRTMERVPKGTEFKGEIVYNFVKKPEQKDDFIDEDFKNLFAGFKLLEDDYLGGSGSRGYGKVEISIEKIILKKKEYYFEKKEQQREILEKEKLSSLREAEKLLLEKTKNFF